MVLGYPTPPPPPPPPTHKNSGEGLLFPGSAFRVLYLILIVSESGVSRGVKVVEFGEAIRFYLLDYETEGFEID